MDNILQPQTFQSATLPRVSGELARVVDSPVIAYESISEGFGISSDGIENIIERLQQTLPGLHITNGHILAVLMSELAKATATGSERSSLEKPSTEQKIDQIARTYYTGGIWELLESLAFCLRMVEIAHTHILKQQSSRSQREFLAQIVNAVRPACKLAAVGYPEAVQMVFRRFSEMGVTIEQALDLTLEDDRSSLSPFTTERSLLERNGEG
jgi:hypothetical protein